MDVLADNFGMKQLREQEVAPRLLIVLPGSPPQAFAICVTAMSSKLACE